MCATITNTTSTVKSLQARFLALLPRIESQARIYFRGIRCRTKKADCVAEVVAMCWKWFCRLAKRGKDATQFVGALAALAARAVWSGRRAHRSEPTTDVMSSVAQRRHGFVVQPFPPVRQSRETLYSTVRGQQIQDGIEERLVDNRVTPVPEQAGFRLDFPSWLKTLTERERRIIRAMSWNERTKELSRRFRVTPGRISQMRREFSDDWRRFVGDEMTAS
jgi:hypothetical protein